MDLCKKSLESQGIDGNYLLQYRVIRKQIHYTFAAKQLSIAGILITDNKDTG